MARVSIRGSKAEYVIGCMVALLLLVGAFVGSELLAGPGVAELFEMVAPRGVRSGGAIAENKVFGRFRL